MSGEANIRERLFALGDERYAGFQSALIPNIPKETVIGVRMPMTRKLAKEIAGAEEMRAFLAELPHAYYDENILHSVLLSQMKDYDTCMEAVEAFLPHIDNWAVCDCLSPKAFAGHKPEAAGKYPRMGEIGTRLHLPFRAGNADDAFSGRRF